MTISSETARTADAALAVKRRPLGASGIMISELAFGAGPVSGLMTRSDEPGLQRATVARAIEMGITWFDTAAAYGGGESEASLGRVLAEVQADETIRLATKVRLKLEDLADIGESIKASVAASLRRLRRPRITLLQLHNGITRSRGEWPDSITPSDVLGGGGVLDAFERLRADGVVSHFGLTGQGNRSSLDEVMAAGRWASIQVNEHALIRRARGSENFLEACARRGVGVLAIRVLAGGALAGQPPSAHTLGTRFFPLDVYQRDQRNAARVAAILPGKMTLPELAVRHVLGNALVASAVIGFANPQQVDDAVGFARAGALPGSLRAALEAIPLPEETP